VAFLEPPPKKSTPLISGMKKEMMMIATIRFCRETAESSFFQAFSALKVR